MQWGSCSSSCGDGKRIRNRMCEREGNAASDCVGLSRQEGLCNLRVSFVLAELYCSDYIMMLIAEHNIAQKLLLNKH